MTVDYGTDLSCTFVTETLEFPDGTFRTFQAWDAPGDDFPTVSGRPLLIEALLRRLITPRGALLGDPDYGTDVRAWINKAMNVAQIARLGGLISAELAKDERVKSAAASATFANSKLTVLITIVDGAGPFKLTVEVTDVTLKLLGVS